MKNPFNQNSFLAFVLALSLLPAAAQGSIAAKVVFVDEAKKDATLVAFRTKLLDIAKRQDKKQLLNLLDPKVMYADGGGVGIRDFSENWELNKKTSEFWSELTRALSGGGYFDKDNGRSVFHAPYYKFYLPNDKLDDSIGRAVVVGSNVPLFAQSNDQSPQIGTLSDELVGVPDEETEGLTKIVTTSGASGYVADKFLHFQDEPFVLLAKGKTGWRIVWFGSQSP